MTDNRCECAAGNCFKEAVCIDAGRVYDSCCDKDCIEDIRVYFTDCGQSLIENAVSIRGKSVKVLTTYIDVEPVPFNKGYYSVDMTFYFEVEVEVCCSPTSNPTTVTGVATFNKKVILYGSDGNVKIFSSELREGCSDEPAKPSRNLPRAVVQVAEPILLSTHIGEERICDKCCCCIPQSICCRYDGELALCDCKKVVFVTIGLFTIIQMERQVQMLVPVYDFCMPCKECVTSCDDPCELFSKIQFPADQFFPPRSQELADKGPCGRSNSQLNCRK